MDHRRTVGRRAFVPPVWLIVVALVAIVVGAAGLGWLAWDATRGSDPESVASASESASATPTPAATSSAPTTAAPTTVAPPPSAEPEPVADRSPGVSILNGSGVNGLAGDAADLLGDLGWDDLRTGDTRGTYPENTVYYPPQLEAQAQTLAQDLGITRIRPSVDGMRDDRLTAVLISRPSSLS
ncbi:MAG: LytR C-terminal domain-containing protein [Aeromicrobium sp.]|uniref:LytR C-terminal domain-containing protein n=1 Tax=Aeromicrobium sp. TaxID=1871063 RepID=UPI00261D3783|nr:LytR C-terminal domain-containing protein [Aeromicrobium sp.]MDF1704213.1 LytR C-terminal domain-containing protein [Aeromicrobium sp.]